MERALTGLQCFLRDFFLADFSDCCETFSQLSCRFTIGVRTVTEVHNRYRNGDLCLEEFWQMVCQCSPHRTESYGPASGGVLRILSIDFRSAKLFKTERGENGAVRVSLVLNEQHCVSEEIPCLLHCVYSPPRQHIGTQRRFALSRSPLSSHVRQPQAN